MADPVSWHSHVYFDAASHPRAEALVAAMQRHFGPDSDITYDRWHHRPLGTQTDFSIQLAFPHTMFAAVITFLPLNRNGLTIFTPPNTGETAVDALRDQTDHAVWMGRCGH